MTCLSLLEQTLRLSIVIPESPVGSMGMILASIVALGGFVSFRRFSTKKIN